MCAMVEAHRNRFGVAPICEVLQIAPSAYRRHAARRRDRSLLSARAHRDAELAPKIEMVWRQNQQVYGADKVWKQMNREGEAVARCTVERLMRRLGLRGARRGKAVRTTRSDKKHRARWTRSTGSSGPSGPINCGCPTSPMSRPGRADYRWPSSWTSSPVAS